MTKKKKRHKKKRLPRHDWDKWFKRKRFTLIRGEHFSGMPHAMSAQVRNAACKRGLTVSVRILENILVVERTN